MTVFLGKILGTEQMFGLAKLFSRTFTVRFGLNDRILEESSSKKLIDLCPVSKLFCLHSGFKSFLN